MEMAFSPPPAPTLCALSPNHTYLCLELEAFLVQTNRTHDDLESGPVWILFSQEQRSDPCASYFPDMTFEETCMYFVDFTEPPSENETPPFVQNEYGWLVANVRGQGWIQFRCTAQAGEDPCLQILQINETGDPDFVTLLLQHQQHQPS